MDKLLPAFNTGSGLPYGMVNMRTGRSRNGWKGQSILSEFGTLSMEFTYLSDITGDKKYVNTIEKMQDVIEKYNHDGNIENTIYFGGRIYYVCSHSDCKQLQTDEI